MIDEFCVYVLVFLNLYGVFELCSELTDSC